MASDRQLDVLREWARSKNGSDFYRQLTRDFQSSQSVEQLALTTAALMNYLRLLPNLFDNSDQPINVCYLADLDALLHGNLLRNSGRVVEQMVFALIRVLQSDLGRFDLITFLETALDRDHPLLHIFNGFSDQYLFRRVKGEPHKTVLSRFELPGLSRNNDVDWVNVMP